MALKRYDGTPIIQDRDEWVALTLGMPVILDLNNWPSYNFIELYNSWRSSLPYNSFKYLEGGVGFTDSLILNAKLAVESFHNYAQDLMDQMRNNPGKFLSLYNSGQVSPEKLSFTQKYNNLSSGTRAGIQAGASIGGNVLYNWASGNRRTNAGSALNSIGDAAIATGNPYAIIGGIAAKGLGVLANRAFGNDPKAMQRYNHHINSMMAQDFSGDPVAAVNNSMAGMNINRKDFGWANLGDYHKVKSAMDFAEKRADLSGQHAIYKWDKKMLNDNLSTHYALGGFLETDTPIGLSLAVQETVNDRMKLQDRGFMPKNIFAEGGTAGLNMDDGISYIGNGGSHEENLYGGVPQGVAPDGQPNLVEEGEYKVKLKDGEEMFSERLTVPLFKRQRGELLSKALKIANKYHTERGRTFAQAIRKAMHDTGYEEGESDPISQAGFFDIAENLKIIQDLERAKQQLGDQASEIANMTPEEFALQQEMEKQLLMAQLQQELMEQQAAQLQAMQQLGMPEQGMPQEQMPPELMIQLGPMGYMGAYGGHLYGVGDTLNNADDFLDFLNDNGLDEASFFSWWNNLPASERARFLKEAEAMDYYKLPMTSRENDEYIINNGRNGERIILPAARAYADYISGLPQTQDEFYAENALPEYSEDDYRRARTRLNRIYRENNITKDALTKEVLDKHLLTILDNPDLKGQQLTDKVLEGTDLKGIRGRKNRASHINNRYEIEKREQFLFGTEATPITPVDGKFKRTWDKGEFKPLSPIDGLAYDEKNKTWSLGDTPLDLATEENRKLFQSLGDRTTTTSGIDIKKYQKMYEDAIEQRFKEREGDKYDPDRLKRYYLSNDELRQWINDLAEGKVSLDGYTPEELKTLSGLIGNIWTNNLDENGLPIEQDWYRKQYADIGKRTDHKPGIMHVPYEEGATETIDNIRGKVGRIKIGEDKYAYIPYSTDNPYYTFSEEPTAMGNLDVYEVTGGTGNYHIGVLPNGRYVRLSDRLAEKIPDYEIEGKDLPDYEDPLGYSHLTHYYDLSKGSEPYRTLGWTGVGSDFPEMPIWPYLMAAGISLVPPIHALLTPTDFSNANALINAGKQAGQYKEIGFTPLGTYEKYNPIPDRENEISSSTAGANRNIMNVGLNPGQEMAGIVANTKTGIEETGKDRINTAGTNQQLRMAVDNMNYEMNKFNSEGQLKADMANQDAFSRSRAAALQGLMAGYRLKEEIARNKANAISAGLTGAANMIFNAATNKYHNDWLRWATDHDVHGTIRGASLPTWASAPYSNGQKKQSYGGTVSKKKKAKRRKNGLTF